MAAIPSFTALLSLVCVGLAQRTYVNNGPSKCNLPCKCWQGSTKVIASWRCKNDAAVLIAF